MEENEAKVLYMQHAEVLGLRRVVCVCVLLVFNFPAFFLCLFVTINL